MSLARDMGLSMSAGIRGVAWFVKTRREAMRRSVSDESLRAIPFARHLAVFWLVQSAELPIETTRNLRDIGRSYELMRKRREELENLPAIRSNHLQVEVYLTISDHYTSVKTYYITEAPLERGVRQPQFQIDGTYSFNCQKFVANVITIDEFAQDCFDHESVFAFRGLAVNY